MNKQNGIDESLFSKRAYPRKLLQGQGFVTHPVCDQNQEVILLDISLGGVAFLSKQEFDKDSLWLVRFPVGEKLLTGNIQIIYCIMHSMTNAYRVGAQFKRLLPEQLAIIEHYTK